MNKVIEAIDSVLYDTVLWLWLIPKTVWNVTLRPTSTIDCVSAELSKPAEERFNDFMPPVLFLIVAGVLPLTGFIDSLATSWLKHHASDFLRDFVARPWDVQLMFVAVAMASAPMSVAISIQLFRSEAVGRSQLRPVFLSQAYLFGAFYGFAFVGG